MANVPVVSDLPVIDQKAFPPLPQIESGYNFVFVSSPWYNGEKEEAASNIITICAEKGEWCPVDVSTWFNQMQTQAIAHMMPQDILNATWALIAEGDLQIVQVEGQKGQFLIPQPSLAEKALRSDVRITEKLPPIVTDNPQT